jgi:hypothetical protein
MGWAECSDTPYVLIIGTKSNATGEYVTMSKYTQSFGSSIQIHNYPGPYLKKKGWGQNSLAVHFFSEKIY